MTRVGRNIRILRERLGLSQNKVAELCGWDSGSRVSNYENTPREPGLDDIVIIARVLNVSPATLAFDDFPISKNFPDPKINGIPVLNWETASDWPANKKTITDNKDIDFIGQQLILGVNCYALKIEDDLMMSRAEEHFFKEGSYIIVDPEKKPKDRNFVVAKGKSQKSLIFRQYRNDGYYEYLSLFKDNHPRKTMDLTPDITICGIVVAYFDLLL
jgi:SOS-response transcriptional repressor LexA